MPKITQDCIDRLNHALPISRYLTPAERYPREYACINPDCRSNHHVLVYEDNTCTCMKCRKEYNLIGAVMEIKGVAFPDAAAELSQAANIPLEYEGGIEIADPPKPKTTTPGKYRDDIAKWKTDADPAREYLRGRGISDETIDKYDLAYKTQYFHDAGRELPAVVFSYREDLSYWAARSLDGKYFYKPKADEAGDEPLYRPEQLDSPQPCFVVESQIDALSLIQSGAPAVALCGTGYSKLLPAVKGRKTPLILSLDHDDDGQKAQAALAKDLDALNVPYAAAFFDYDKYNGPKKDANDLLRSSAAQLKLDAWRNMEIALRPDALINYIQTQMQADIDKLHEDASRKTGFKNLDDAAGGLYSGFYVAGGLPAVGKTTLFLQIANQLAERGQHVLFFSLEQSRLEMVAKSIACRTKINGNGVDASRIRQGERDENIDRAFSDYAAAVGDRLTVIEGNFDCNVSFVEKYTRDYIERNNARPVIILDYLQIIGAPLDPDTHRKPTDPRQIIDANVTALKRISRDLSIPVIAISSMNRANYVTPIDFESFRESSSIEYTADCLLGVQLAAIHGDIFDSDPKKDITKKREAITAAKNSNPREIELVCLKNRYGRNYSCTFKYYPQYDYFVPDDDDFTPADNDPFDNLPLN